MATSSCLSPASIKKFFHSLPDPRQRPTRNTYPLLSVVVMGLCGVIGGADTWEEIAEFCRQRRDWLSRFVDMSEGVPSHDTFGRVFAALDPKAFQRCLLAWVQALHEVTKGQVIAIDGKVAREAMARATDKGPLCLVSAWAKANHVVLGQLAAESGSNELGTLPKLLELLDLHGAIVTLDALGCQKEIVKQIVAQKGDYVISVKGNQEKLERAVQLAFHKALDEEHDTTTVERKECQHGRQEHRIYTAIPVPKEFAELEHWQGLQSLLMVTREYTTRDGTQRTGTRYFISSLPTKVRELAKAARDHWKIENSMGWILDVSFTEDRNRARDQHAQANLGMLRRVALSLVKNTEGLKGSIKCKRKQAGWNDEILKCILFRGQSGQT